MKPELVISPQEKCPVVLVWSWSFLESLVSSFVNYYIVVSTI